MANEGQRFGLGMGEISVYADLNAVDLRAGVRHVAAGQSHRRQRFVLI